MQIVLICLEAVIALAFLPLNISVTCHVSLARRSAEADVKIFSFRAVRVRLGVKNGRFGCTVNGKKPKKPTADPQKTLKSAVKFLCSDVSRRGVSALKIGLADAMMSAEVGAMINVLLMPLAKGGVYIGEADGFELDVSMRMKLNLLQIADIAL